MRKGSRQNRALARALEKAGLPKSGETWAQAKAFLAKGAIRSDVVKYLIHASQPVKVASLVTPYTTTPARGTVKRERGPYVHRVRAVFQRVGTGGPLHGEIRWSAPRPKQGGGVTHDALVMLDGGTEPANEYTMSVAAVEALQRGQAVPVWLYGLGYQAQLTH